MKQFLIIHHIKDMLLCTIRLFPEGWHEWVAAAKAKPVYGAKSFLKYADKKGIDIYYISDRDKEKILKLQRKI